MQDLRLIAANERGSHLVLRSADGDKFVVSIDERLRLAVQGDRPAPTPLAGETEGALRPREIQARIRAGATAEQIARSSGIPLERVRRFEGPVLAEREHVVTLAQRSTVRRPGLDARPMSLGETLRVRLTALGVDPERLGWDSWRRDDGRWTVQVAYLLDDRTAVARYVYDLQTRSVEADNDEGRWLTGELQQRPAAASFAPAPEAETRPERAAAPVIQPALPTAPASARPAAVARPAPVAPSAPVQLEVPIPAAAAVARAAEVAATGSTPTGAETPPRAQRPRRANVPAWDDIVFGTRRPDERSRADRS
jgi:Protein of unknown function (DUF3071)